MNQIAEQSERFKQLLSDIDQEVSELKNQIKELNKENSKLKTKLAEARDKQTDIFSAINESERLAMRQHVQGLVKKIDNHLGSGS